MSQISATLKSTPGVPTSFVTDDGTAIPVANTLNLLARDTNENDDNGIKSKADPAGSENLYIELTNRITNTGSTSGAVTDDILIADFSTSPFSGNAGTYNISLSVGAFNSSTPASGSYFFTASIRSDGTTPVVLGSNTDNEFEDAAINASDLSLIVVGNTVVARVTGVAGLDINWNILATYRRTS